MNERIIEGIIVDAGHGGIDSGAVGNSLEEKDLTLQAASYMYQRLNELGIPAKMTREDDEYLPKTDRIRRVLGLYNNNPNTILVSNHINAGGAEGAEVIYSLKNNPTLANLVLNNIGDAGQIKRKAYQRRLPENPNLDYYYILRETGNTEPILIEYGFIDNKKDASKLKNNLLDYVEGVVKALADYTGYEYTPPGVLPNEPSTSDTYIVQKGDTLYSVSKKFNIPVESIKNINNLSSDTLSIGQILKLTPNIIDNNYYIVKPNDTLYSIAKKTNTTVDEIKLLNNLTNNSLFIGQQLLIPNNEDTPEEEIEDEEYTIYTVKKGDSLWKIAREYDISVSDLISLNNLKNLTLSINQQLIVPSNTIIDDDTYIVQKGDTLWSIAKAYGIDVNTLKELNNLDNNLLSVGQELKIK